MNNFNAPVYLVNTGWVGANANTGAKRISLPLTRKIIHRILDGSIESEKFEKDQFFEFQIPMSLNDIDSSILNPKNSWANEIDYYSAAEILVDKFKKNYAKYDLGNNKILNGGPRQFNKILFYFLRIEY